jgi:hypothetical protein
LGALSALHLGYFQMMINLFGSYLFDPDGQTTQSFATGDFHGVCGTFQPSVKA